MKHLTTIAAAGLFAATALTASSADALFLDGTFTIDIYNFDAGGTRANAAATQAIIDTRTLTDTVEYKGALDFHITGTAGSDFTSIGEFFASGTGTVSGFDGGTEDLLLSSGGGSGDAGATASFRTTTLFKITAKEFGGGAFDLNIADLSKIVSVEHDDGITISDGTNSVFNTTVGIEAGPTNIVTTLVVPALSDTAPFGDFSLIYGAANGDPSVLKVSVVPLPAAAWLLLGASGGLIAAKRRSARRAA